MITNYLSKIFLKRCNICGKKINSIYTCENCLNIIEYSKKVVFIPNKNEKYYDRFIGLFEYTGIRKKKMLKLKFENRRPLAKSFGEIVARRLTEIGISTDIIIPVPISAFRFIERGFNQTSCIAKYASTITPFNIDCSILKKVKNIRKQGGLSSKERIDNVYGIYKVINSQKIKGKDVIVLDDIFSTGATINECSKVLKQAGAKSVTAIAILYNTKWKERGHK